MAFGAVGCRKDKMPLVFLSGKIVQNPVKMYTPFFFRVCHSALRAENSNFVVKGRNRMRYLLLFCVCVLAVFDSRVYGKVILKSWQMTTFHGLPNNTVRCLHQDYRGRIWLGTQNEDKSVSFDRRWDFYTDRVTEDITLAGEVTSSNSGKIMGGYGTCLNFGQFAISLISVPLLAALGNSYYELYCLMGAIAIVYGIVIALWSVRHYRRQRESSESVSTA